MKKLTLIILLFVSKIAFANEGYLSNLSYMFLWNRDYILSPFDDTATIQAGLNAGNYLLPVKPGGYFISSPLTATHKFFLNGQVITATQTTGAALLLSTGGSVHGQGGVIAGPYNPATTGDAAGGIGIRMLAAGTEVDSVHVSQFAGYGILGGSFSNLKVDHCLIDKIGYFGFYYDPEANGLSGIIFTNNTVDRSMLNPATALQAGVAIRASTANFADTVKNCTITGNLIIMPYNPGPGGASAAVECLEVRTMANSTVSNNTFIAGTIGASVVHCERMVVAFNKCTNQRDCGIEFADTQDSRTGYNSIKGSLKDGILFDGGNVRCKRDTLLYDTVRTAANAPFHAYFLTRRIVIRGCDFTTVSKGYNLQQTDTVLIDHSKMDGQGLPNTYGIFLDETAGNVTITTGSIVRCTAAVFAYSTTVGMVVNNNVGTNVNLGGTITQFAGTFTNGAHYGTNNHFYVTLLTFNPLAPKNYGAVDFDPGATSVNAITYLSSNPAKATIIANKVHITGTGTVNITAQTIDSSAVQPLTINKVPLLIKADNKIRAYGNLNPPFTATYTGFVYGETHSVLTTQPTLSTTATTFSPPGNYVITNSGAVAANYTITNATGILSVSSNINPYIHKRVRVLKH